MPNAAPTPATLRLLACVEAFSHEEEGAVGHDDWPALAALFDRELALLTRLAEEHPCENLPDLQARVAAIQTRYAGLGRRLADARERVREELAELSESGRRSRAVRSAYGSAA